MEMKYTAREIKNITENYNFVIDELNTFFGTDVAKNVTTMLAAFNRKKSAYESRNTSFQTKGNIDPSRICHYKTSDDIFRRTAIVGKGKNHGVFFLVDWSASMRPVSREVIRQLAINAIFCKRANIPFTAAYFTTSSSWNYGSEASENKNKDYEIANGNLKLKTFFDSNDSIERIKEVVRDVALSTSNWAIMQTNHPEVQKLQSEYEMGSTPLSLSLAEVFPYIIDWKRNQNISEMSLYAITDGEDTEDLSTMNGDAVKSIVNPFTNKRYDITSQNPRLEKTRVVLSMYREMNIKTYNICLVSNSSVGVLRRSTEKNEANLLTEISEDISKHGFSTQTNFMGFDNCLIGDISKIFGTPRSQDEIDADLKNEKLTDTKKFDVIKDSIERRKTLNTVCSIVVDCVTAQYKQK